MPACLYITRNGLLEPLGQSQVLAYLKGLSKSYRISVITFEKADDWLNKAEIARVREVCREHGIVWLPQRFQRRPKLLAPGFGMGWLLALTLREVRAGNVDLIHARSYLPAIVALAAYKVAGVPFIFDMRALWPEELITAGRLKRDSPLHRGLRWAEEACLRRASATVSLTHAAVVYLRECYPHALAEKEITVIPTCTDLGRFSYRPKLPAGPRVYGCVGTMLSGWFRIDWLGQFFAYVAQHDGEARFEILTKDDISAVTQSLAASGVPLDRVTVASVRPDEVAQRIRAHTVSAMFFTSGKSKLGSCPTRMGELLGSGIPIIANHGVGDVARIIQEYRVGVLLEAATSEGMGAAWSALNALLSDTECPQRCREAAEAIFSLEAGINAYSAVYKNVLRGSVFRAAES